jgi:addiction module HigA family antidote
MQKKKETPGTVLNALLEKHGLNYSSLAKAIGLSGAMVRLIALDENPVSAAVAFRLAKFFKMNPEYWLDLQAAFDLAKTAKDKKLAQELKAITTVDKAVKKAAKPGRKAAAAKTAKTAKKGKTAKAAGAGKRGRPAKGAAAKAGANAGAKKAKPVKDAKKAAGKRGRPAAKKTEAVPASKVKRAVRVVKVKKAPAVTEPRPAVPPPPPPVNNPPVGNVNEPSI